jgi:hypothetical protein
MPGGRLEGFALAANMRHTSDVWKRKNVASAIGALALARVGG